ncbi:c-type cytochrome [Dokdonella sp.]|uniref:c-type cytochrome n=1 Tax=Dokdonella sp. TaxID=2291710 RepID=UPI0035272981
MRKLMKWIGRSMVAVVLLLAVGLVAVYLLSEQRMARVYAIEPTVPPVPVDPGAVERGLHVATIRGCRDCHGSDMGSGTLIDDAMFARISGPNLTPGASGGVLSDVDLVRAIRHGVGRNGRSLLLMPSQEFVGLSEQDMGDLLAYLHSLPAVERTPPENRVGPIGRILLVADQVPLLPAEHVDHAAKPEQPVVGATAEYGAYLAAACQGCHGKTFAGGHIAGTPPSWPDAANLTPDPTGLAEWSEADLKKALREGISRDGRPLQTEYMPVSATKHLTDDEVSALYAYLRSVPAIASGVQQ